jgi:hypothetical protein
MKYHIALYHIFACSCNSPEMCMYCQQSGDLRHQNYYNGCTIRQSCCLDFYQSVKHKCCSNSETPRNRHYSQQKGALLTTIIPHEAGLHKKIKSPVSRHHLCCFAVYWSVSFPILVCPVLPSPRACVFSHVKHGSESRSCLIRCSFRPLRLRLRIKLYCANSLMREFYQMEIRFSPCHSDWGLFCYIFCKSKCPLSLGSLYLVLPLNKIMTDVYLADFWSGQGISSISVTAYRHPVELKRSGCFHRISLSM